METAGASRRIIYMETRIIYMETGITPTACISLALCITWGHIQKEGHQQEQDPTNLYISNLPVSMDEQELENMLKPFGHVISTRILRDASGVSRGVGFASYQRMESTEKCDVVIQHFNGKFLKTPPGVPASTPSTPPPPVRHSAELARRQSRAAAAIRAWAACRHPRCQGHTPPTHASRTHSEMEHTQNMLQQGKQRAACWSLKLGAPGGKAWQWLGVKGQASAGEPIWILQWLGRLIPLATTLAAVVLDGRASGAETGLGTGRGASAGQGRGEMRKEWLVGNMNVMTGLQVLTHAVSAAPTEPLLCKFADGGQKKRQSQSKYPQNGRPWPREGESGMALPYDPAAMQNGFYSSPYISTNRMIAQTSITPFIAASPVSTYQVQSTSWMPHQQYVMQPTGAVITPAMDHTISMQPANMMGPLTQQMNHLSLGTSGTYMPAAAAAAPMQGTYIPQYAAVPASAISVEGVVTEASPQSVAPSSQDGSVQQPQQPLCVDGTSDHAATYSYQPAK
ncbi:hypothetical protein P4O66_010202 [Electrophorus voltai]|uniref:RRM domain-containing protein n=1 Tax=Electrophorus voltai TaxID=2609070 RepID=A0AAD8Z8H3_9TELE|nr:hypothetical protein P4O66_010202 [Electrophorus voltai]